MKHEEKIMQMISFGGEAKSLAFESISLAEQGQFEESDATLIKAKEILLVGRKAYTDLLFHEANHQDNITTSLLLIHAADYIANGEDIIELASHFTKVLKEVKGV